MRRLIWALSLLALVALVALRAADPGPVRDLREGYFDLLQVAAPRSGAAMPIRVVDIDEASLAALGQWPWPRSLLADLTDRMFALGAAVVVYDVLFAEPDRLSPARLAGDPRVAAALGSAAVLDRLVAFDTDLRFAEAIAGRPVVLGVADAGPTATGRVEPRSGHAEIGADLLAALPELGSTTPLVPALDAAASGVGVINTGREAGETVVREVPLLWRSGELVLPTLSVEALRLALGESTILLFAAEGEGAGLGAVGLADLAIPTAGDGRFRVHYRPDDPELYISAHHLLDPGEAAALVPRLEGHIVLVGTSAAGLLDIRTTASGEQVPGVSIHAQMLEQMLQGQFLRRDDVTGGVELFALLVMGLTVTAVMARAGPLPTVLTGGLVALALLGGSWAAFTREGVLIDVTFPLVGGFVAFTMLAMLQFVVVDREKRLIRRSFSRYVAPEVLSEIERRGHRLDLGGDLREITVLFCDIRGFTALSETMGPHDLVAMLNDLFTRLSDRILEGRGTIDKFIGDEVMAFWNAPLPTPDHERLACETVLRLRIAVREASEERRRAGKPPLALAMGLACGPACIGNIGSRHRFNYTAIGETVNQAARVQAACRHVGYDALVTAEVAAAAPGLAFLPAGALAFKGVSRRVACRLLVGDAETAAAPAFVELAEQHARLLAVLAAGGAGSALLAQCRGLSGLVDPGLPAFYDRLSGRLEDFVSEADRGAERALRVNVV